MTVIAHGVDMVDIARIAAVLDRHPERFLSRCFTDGECAYAEAGGKLRAQRYAVRFAAKEAVFKCLGTGWAQGVEWRDVDVRRTLDGAPFLHMSGRAAEVAASRGVTAWSLSLSHTRDMGIASVIASAPEVRRPVG